MVVCETACDVGFVEETHVATDRAVDEPSFDKLRALVAVVEPTLTLMRDRDVDCFEVVLSRIVLASLVKGRSFSILRTRADTFYSSWLTACDKWLLD